MQRTQRVTAGNIYKKRREEIQMVLSLPKERKKKTRKVRAKKKSPSSTAGHVGKRATKRPRRASKSSKGLSGADEDLQDSNDSLPSEGFLREEDFPDEDSYDHDGELSSRNRNSASTSSNSKRTSSRVSNNLNNKFKCRYCPVSFAEERYVEFHILQKHKTSLQEERKMHKKKVQQAKMHFKQLTQRKSSGFTTTKDDDNDASSDSEMERDGDDDAFDMMDQSTEHFDLDQEFLEEDGEEYYEKITRDDGEKDMYKCKKCSDFQVTSKHVLMTHIKRHLSTTSNHKCPYCDSQFKNRASLEVHMYTHTGVKPFCCKVCDLSFKCMDDLLLHSQLSHSPDEMVEKSIPFISTEKKPISTKYAAASHYQSTSQMSQKRKHKCPYCAERFISEINLGTHISIHNLKGLTDEEKAEEKKTRKEATLFPSAKSEQGGDTYNANIQIPSTSKRRLEPPAFTSKSKKKKEEESGSGVATLPAPNPVIMDGPPRCKICGKVFLYTTYAEKHMREVHPESEETKLLEPILSPDKKEVNRMATTYPTRHVPSTVVDESSSSTSLEKKVPRAIESTAAVNDQTKAEDKKVVTEKVVTPTSIEIQSCAKSTAKSTTPPPPLPTTTIATSSQADERSEPEKPIKSVYLLIDRSSNTCIPISPSLLGLSDEAGTSNTPVGKNVLSNGKPSFPSTTISVSDLLNQSSENSEQSSEASELGVDQELALELEKLGTRGTPLSAGADNQHLQHTCKICNENIVGYTEVVKHLHTHTVGENFVCHICNKAFSSKSSLGVHFLIHLGISFSCPLCQKKLAKKQSLLEHLRYHKGERRHVCNECEKSFITSSSLNRHNKMHEAQRLAETTAIEPAFSCEHCEWKFNDAIKFANHMKAHDIINTHTALDNGEPAVIVPFICQYCSKMWGSARGLCKHLKVDHGFGSAKTVASKLPTRVPMVKVIPRSVVKKTPVMIAPAAPHDNKVIDVIDISDDEDDMMIKLAESEIVIKEILEETSFGMETSTQVQSQTPSAEEVAPNTVPS